MDRNKQSQRGEQQHPEAVARRQQERGRSFQQGEQSGVTLQRDQGRPPTSEWMEQQGGFGHQQERGRGAPGEMRERAGSARQQGDVNFESDEGEGIDIQPAGQVEARKTSDEFSKQERS